MDTREFWKPFRGAVSLTFDDGLPCQLSKALPAMDKLGIKGTFYLCPGGKHWQEELSPWLEIAGKGHEIGNHTMSHTCSRNFRGDRGLEDMTLTDIEKEILAAQERLVRIAPHQKDWTFCYPCYQTHVGRGQSRQSYVPVVARHFLAARTGGEYGYGNHPHGVDLQAAWGLRTDRMSGFEMIGLVEELTWQGRWVILVFHEIDGARLTVGSHDFQMLLDFLHRRSDDIWTAPVSHVARKIASQRLL